MCEKLSGWIDSRHAPWLLALYAAGVAVMLLRLVRGFWYASRLARGGEVVGDEELFRYLQQLSHQWRLRVAPVLKQTGEVVVPKVVGLLRPTILLPTSALTGLTQQELEMVLAHELAHVRRGDMWLNLVQRLAAPRSWYASLHSAVPYISAVPYVCVGSTLYCRVC